MSNCNTPQDEEFNWDEDTPADGIDIRELQALEPILELYRLAKKTQDSIRIHYVYNPLIALSQYEK
ncbi:hypothetical protein KY362_01570 [Candidatus Woesearchaeota archaeon]|nr:hypothetical protein [Candidatus Woesearchaeota archaeon]